MLVPIPKPGASGRFRPISLTYVISRIAERLVNKVFMQWLEPHLPQEQAGFRIGRSTEEQIATMCESVTNGWNERKILLATFCDFSKPYDRAPHHLLFSKLHSMNCPVHLWRWLRCFVMDRRWKCRWNTAVTKEVLVRQGLPQVATLSPGLWLAFLIDLPKSIQHNSSSVQNCLFADDTTIWATASTPEDCKEQLQAAL